MKFKGTYIFQRLKTVVLNKILSCIIISFFIKYYILQGFKIERKKSFLEYDITIIGCLYKTLLTYKL